MPAGERDEVVAEIRGYVLERVEAGGFPTRESVEAVLSAVGDPRRLASEYETAALLRGAQRSRSPWLLLRATLRWAAQGVAGLLGFLLSITGYGAALVCYACAVAKPLFPSRIGVWLTPEHAVTVGYWNGRLPTELMGLSVGPPGGLVVFGTMGVTPGPLRELLGLWLTPVGIVVGLLVALATTWGVRRLIGRHLARGVPRPAF